MTMEIVWQLGQLILMAGMFWLLAFLACRWASTTNTAVWVAHGLTLAAVVAMAASYLPLWPEASLRLKYVLGYFAAINLLSVPLFYKLDKRRAVFNGTLSGGPPKRSDEPLDREELRALRELKRQQRDRIPEASLHWLAALGGAPAAFLSQRLFTHKKSKQSFMTRFYFTAVFFLGMCVLAQQLLTPDSFLHEYRHFWLAKPKWSG